MNNRKVVVRKSAKFEKGIFAKQDIDRGEVIAVFDGKIYEAEKASDLPNKPPLEVRDHAIQFDAHKWKDSKGIARYINHSCNPNCGIKDLFKIVTMRNIRKGEELTLDYAMVENSDWVMECKCGEKNCRKIIRGYRFLPKIIRKKYNGHISEWLTGK